MDNVRYNLQGSWLAPLKQKKNQGKQNGNNLFNQEKQKPKIANNKNQVI